MNMSASAVDWTCWLFLALCLRCVWLILMHWLLLEDMGIPTLYCTIQYRLVHSYIRLNVSFFRICPPEHRCMRPVGILQYKNNTWAKICAHRTSLFKHQGSLFLSLLVLSVQGFLNRKNVHVCLLSCTLGTRLSLEAPLGNVLKGKIINILRLRWGRLTL